MGLDAGNSDALESDQSGRAVDLVAAKMKVKESIHKTAIKNIKISQQRTKSDYDKKHCLMQVS